MRGDSAFAGKSGTARHFATPTRNRLSRDDETEARQL